jgi:hypothetical protein
VPFSPDSRKAAFGWKRDKQVGNPVEAVTVSMAMRSSEDLRPIDAAMRAISSRDQLFGVFSAGSIRTA